MSEFELLRKIHRHEAAVAEAVTADFLRRHPDWVRRYGERARERGVEDAVFHLRFQSAAIEARSPSAFDDYVRWTARVLEARGIERRFLGENLEQIRDALAPHLTSSESAVVASFLKMPDSLEVLPPAPEFEAPLALTRRIFTQAVLRGERRAALNIALEALHHGASMPEVYIEVFQQALYDVGSMWERNTITVAQEHMATAVTQYVMAHIFERIERPDVRRGRAVITGVAGELHQVGAMMVSDVLERGSRRGEPDTCTT